LVIRHLLLMGIQGESRASKQRQAPMRPSGKAT
jgi:hypothetical protein